MFFCPVAGELPGNMTLYDFFFDRKKNKWIPWTQLVPDYVHNPEAKFYEILVPTVDTVRATWLLKLMVETRKPVVLIGETGTSKTATIANYLRTLDSEQVVRREAGIAQWLERRTRDRKVAGSNP